LITLAKTITDVYLVYTAKKMWGIVRGRECALRNQLPALRYMTPYAAVMALPIVMIVKLQQLG
jgi:hypothetical protein